MSHRPVPAGNPLADLAVHAGRLGTSLLTVTDTALRERLLAAPLTRATHDQDEIPGQEDAVFQG